MSPTNLTARIEAMINESTDAHENGDNTVSALSVALLLLDVQAHLAQSPLREAPAPQPASVHEIWAKRVGAALEEIHNFQDEDARRYGPYDTIARLREILQGFRPETPQPEAAPTTEKGGE